MGNSLLRSRSPQLLKHLLWGRGHLPVASLTLQTSARPLWLFALLWPSYSGGLRLRGIVLLAPSGWLFTMVRPHDATLPLRPQLMHPYLKPLIPDSQGLDGKLERIT